jgi:hypothetical protein
LPRKFVLLIVGVALGSAALQIALCGLGGGSPVPQPAPPANPKPADPAHKLASECLLQQRVALIGESPESSMPIEGHGGEEPKREQDKEWNGLPRTEETILFPERFLEGTISQFPVERVFRSADMNAFDIYVSKPDRAMVSDFIVRELKKLADLQHAVQDVGYHWLRDQIVAGTVKPLRYGSSPKVAEYLKRNAEPGAVFLQAWLYEDGYKMDWIYSVQGVVYGVNFASVPVTKDAHALLLFSRQNLALQVGAWFHSRGYIPPHQWGLYTGRVYEPR